MFPKTSSRAVRLRHHIIHTLRPRQPSTSPPPSSLYNRPAPTVASLRPLSSLSSLARPATPISIPTATPSSKPLSASLGRVAPSPSPSSSSRTTTPLHRHWQTSVHCFSSSARNSFRPTAGTMVVHNIKDRTSFETAVSTTTAVGAASNAATTGQKTPLIVIDCFATWCPPCKAIAPKLVELSEQHPNVGFYKVDVDECPDVAQELGVRAMPTFVFFKDGQKVDEVVGAVPASILAVIQRYAS
ncbi:thioredoxin [Histoplasma capsulatum var. duboisii H88]|uniref:Thioredoxin n=1 Tax=Ajellomyces capsulatus (strain H88) TaxID=544711 RepID=F0UMX5_AJEC8|nr:thioredoxin [Histoplasma capsulatum var. duboisii H88]QSS53618.1 thioredoxin [Histoplasma capsulatum var. duboisii H88]